MRRVLGVDIGSTWTKAALVRPRGPARPPSSRRPPCRPRSTTSPRAWPGLARGLLDLPTARRSARPCRRPLHALLGQGRPGDRRRRHRARPDRESGAPGRSLGRRQDRRAPLLSARLRRSRPWRASGPTSSCSAAAPTAATRAYVRANAQALARSGLECDHPVRGQRLHARRGGSDPAARKRLAVTANAMPEVGRAGHRAGPRGHPGDVYLDAIVEGRGLARVQRDWPATRSAHAPGRLRPARRPRGGRAGWDELLLIDMGGATTDVYSRTRDLPRRGGMGAAGHPRARASRAPSRATSACG